MSGQTCHIWYHHIHIQIRIQIQMHMNKHMCIHKHPHKHIYIYIYTQYTHVYIIHLISVHLTSNHLPFLTFAQAFVRSVVFRQLDRAGAVLQSQSGAQGDWRLAQAELGVWFEGVGRTAWIVARGSADGQESHVLQRAFWHGGMTTMRLYTVIPMPVIPQSLVRGGFLGWFRWCPCGSTADFPLTPDWFAESLDSTPRMVQRQVWWVSLAMSHVDDLDFPGMVLRCAWLDQRTAPCTAFLRHDWRQFFGDLGVQIIDGHRKWFLSNAGKTMP